MLKRLPTKLAVLCLSFLVFHFSLFTLKAQTGLRITVTDKITGQPISFANVGVLKNGVVIASGAADIDGVAEIKPLDPDKYDVKVEFLAYNTYIQQGVQVTQDAMSRVYIQMESEIKDKPGVTIVGHTVAGAILNPGTAGGGHKDSLDIQSAPSQNINNIASTIQGVHQNDVGGDLDIRGGRPTETKYYVDGIPVQTVANTGQGGEGGLPSGIVDNVSVVTGGTPAKYGDVTGGVVEIHTISTATKFFGSIQGYSSNLFDQFGHDDIQFSVGGPLLWKKDSAHKKKFPLVDFIIGGEYTHQRDDNPSFLGDYYANNSTLSQLQANPLSPNPLGGFNSATEYIGSNDINHSAYNLNDASDNIQLNGKLDFRISEGVKLTVGGSYQYITQNDLEQVYEMFDYAQDPLENTTNSKVYARLTQKFYSSDKTSLIKNAYYSIQAGYSHYYNVTENSQFKDNLFDYGYVGQFYQYLTPVYAQKSGDKGFANYMTGYSDSAYTFKPSSLNPLEANYTLEVYKALGQSAIINQAVVQENNGILNGATPENASYSYALYQNNGLNYGGYTERDYNQFNFSANFNAEIAHNSIEVGFEYEQNNDNFYSINAAGLWSLMRQITDFQLVNFDTANPQLVAGKSGTLPYYNYDYISNAATQTQFDKSLRQKLGLPANSTTYIQPDNYGPGMYSLSMFSAADLINSGNSYPDGGGSVNYFGYDYKGQLLSGTPSINDFFNQRDANGNLYYPQAAYSPIYLAGYIQDHFDIKNIVFDVGLRVDQFNANQYQLKDPYLLYPAKDVAELAGTQFAGEVPSGIGSNYVVYVNNANSPTAIVGYRNGNSWYNAQGNLVQDPTVIASATTTGTIQPYLENPTQSQVEANAFTTYTPQTNVMPRIAFSFPITTKALFFAHYDVLTQRPPGFGYNIFQAVNYLYLPATVNTTGAINNPALAPQQTVDYELGFSQVLNEAQTMALTISAFYRDIKSNIDEYKLLDAYPITYVTFDNIDFGTVKGLEIQYVFHPRELSDVRLSANYSLQFATGTGSGPTSGVNLAGSGEPALQIPMALSYDQRNTINLGLDFHFGAGDNYDGPVITTHSGHPVQFLSNAGFNINFSAGSGTPYTAYSIPYELGAGLNSITSFTGTINGVYLPWQSRVDARVDKTFKVKIKNHPCQVQVYISATNALNTENILKVFPYTGSPTDDGFLASAKGQQLLAQASIVSAAAFTAQYKDFELTEPSYFTLPRQARLGVIFNF